MDITRFAIERRAITTVALVVIFMAGLSAYFSLPRSEDPGFLIRTALVSTIFPGASPERVELLVTDKLEKVIQEIPELDFVNSESRTGVSIVIVNILESENDIRPIWDNLRRKVDKARADLPEGIIGPTVDDEFGDVFGIVYTLTGDGYTYAELKEVADQVRNEMLRLRDAAKVEIHGEQDERVFVEYNNARLAELGLSTSQLVGILESSNIIIPGGNISTAQERFELEPSGNFESVEDLRRTVVSLPSGEVVFLEDIVSIERGYIDPPSKKVYSAGVPALALAISMREGGNIIDLGMQVRDLVHQLEQRYPVGIEFEEIAFQPDIVDRKVKDFTSNLLQAILIVILVMLVTLGVRTGLIVAALIPMTIIMSLLIMQLLNIGLDQMSLAALIVALGLLVDAAIVMSESILVQMEEGKSPVDAAVDTAGELRIPLLTSSLTTVAAFLPIYLAESTTGEYVAPLFKVVAIALLSAWVLALTMTPLLCVLFLKVKKKREEGDAFTSRFYRIYRKGLLVAVRHRLLTVVGAVGLLFASVWAMGFVEQAFFPRKDARMFTAEIELPFGVPFERTERIVNAVEWFMRDSLRVEVQSEDGLNNWATFIGSGAPRFVLSYGPEQPRPNYAYMLVNATSYEAQPPLIDRLERFVTNNFPEVTVRLEQLQNGPPLENPIQVRLSGDDPNVIFNIADELKAKLADLPGTRNIGDDWGARTKKLEVRVNQPRARRAGVTNRDIAVSLQTALSGYETTQYREDDKLIPVVLRSGAAYRDDIGKLESINVYAQSTGRNVPLKQVADVELSFSPSKILRRNRAKTVTVHADIDPASGMTAFDLIPQLDAWLQPASASWPVGYIYEFGGEIESSGKAQTSIGAKLPIAALLIVLLLVGQFNSLRKPTIILLTIPLGLIGVVIGLLVTGKEFGFVTLIGIISLAGIVINNAIVLIDRIQIEIDENGRAPTHAVIESAQRRLRPILLTTATTSGGLVPLWLGGGPLFESMAVAILFGLLFATVLTLGFVPTLYSLFFRVKFKDFVYPGDEPPPPPAPSPALDDDPAPAPA